MYIIPIVLILLQVAFSFYLSNKNAVLKEKIAHRNLVIEEKENKIVIANNKVMWHEQRNETIFKGLLSIKNFEKLNEEIKFPIELMEDGSGKLYSRRCENGCEIESHLYPSYDMALMASKMMTDLGFKMEKEYCSDCKKRTNERSEEHEALVKAQKALNKARKK